METIETRVLPIEYDDNTEVKAKEIKNILERKRFSRCNKNK